MLNLYAVNILQRPGYPSPQKYEVAVPKLKLHLILDYEWLIYLDFLHFNIVLQIATWLDVWFVTAKLLQVEVRYQVRLLRVDLFTGLLWLCPWIRIGDIL